MSKESVSDDGRFPMSVIKYHSNRSSIINFFSFRKKEKIVFYSDGMLELEGDRSDIIDKSSFKIFNIHDAESIIFRSARYKNRLAYNVLQVSAFLSAILIMINIEYFFNFIFGDYDPSNLMLLCFFSPIIFLFSDLKRDLFAESGAIIIKQDEQNQKVINGDLPDADIHSASSVFFLFFVITFSIIFIDSVQFNPLFEDLVFTILGFIILSALAAIFFRIIFPYKEINGIDKNDITSNITHLYFAMMSVKQNNNVNLFLQDEDISKELDEIRESLRQYQDFMQSIVSAEQIFNASNPSMGVLAIGISTETIMKHACERIGINFKPSAIMTLDPLIKQYNREAGIDSRIKSYLEIIKQMRNRAAHDFNINWQEFKTTLDQFCEVVKWYYSVFDESE